MVTTTVDKLDVCETDVYEDSGDEYFPDSEETSDDNTDGESSCSFDENLKLVCNDGHFEKQEQEAFSENEGNSDLSLEIPVRALQKTNAICKFFKTFLVI